MVLLGVDRNMTNLVIAAMTEHEISHRVPRCGPVVVIKIVTSLSPATVTFCLVIGVQVPVEAHLQGMGSDHLRDVVADRRNLGILAKRVIRPASLGERWGVIDGEAAGRA